MPVTSRSGRTAAVTRRNLLLAAAATCGVWCSPVARAAGAGNRRFVLVFAHGGWDGTRVFAPAFDNPRVDLEPEAERWTVGDLALVDHPSRPSVRAYFERHHRDTAVVDGLLVPSVSHETCAQIVMTGGTRGLPDWGALLAGLEGDRYTLPDLVIDCPSFPAQYGGAVARAGAAGQLDGLVDRSLLARADAHLALPDLDVEGAVDRFLLRRAAAVEGAGDPHDAALFGQWADAARRAIDLEDARHATTFGAEAGFEGKIDVVIEALSKGLSRCVSLAFPGPTFTWDTHADNDARQAPLWEALFAGLLDLRERLASTPGPEGRPLAEDVVVVVVSEMSRTPRLNSDRGKDHWPYTSAMLFGAGLRGVGVGGFDGGFRGAAIDLATGARRAGGVVPTASHLGATLLALADEDPSAHLPGYGPIGALLA